MMLPQHLAAVAASAGLKGPPLTDQTGRTIAVGAGLTTLKGVKSAWPGGHRLMEVAPGAELYADDSTFDGAGMTNLFAAALQVQPTSAGQGSSARATYRRSRFDNAAMSFLKSFGSCLTLEECFLGAFGLNSPKDAHLEQIFVNAGALNLIRTVHDGSEGAGRMAGGVTGLVYLEASTGPIFATMIGGALLGTKAIKAPAAIQISSRPHPVVLVVGDMLVERGTSQHIAVTEAGGPVQVIDIGGSRDVETGAPVDLSYPKRGQGPRPNPLLGSIAAERDQLAARLAAARQALS